MLQNGKSTKKTALFHSVLDVIYINAQTNLRKFGNDEWKIGKQSLDRILHSLSRIVLSITRHTIDIGTMDISRNMYTI